MRPIFEAPVLLLWVLSMLMLMVMSLLLRITARLAGVNPGCFLERK